MKNKVNYLLCALVIFIFSCVSALCSAENGPEYEAVAVLNSIGIIKGERDDIKLDEKLSRANAALWMSNLLGNGEEYDYSVFEDVTSGTKSANAIMSLYKRNIIAGYNNKFRPNDNITQNEFYSMLCNTIGYSEIAKIRGGYPEGVAQVMAELGVPGGVAVSPSSVTLGQAARMVINALNAPALEFEFKGGTFGYKKSEKLVMNEFLDLYKVKGWVEANSRTSLYDPNGGKKDSITIDRDTYTARIENADDLLGLYVEAYVHIDADDEGTVVAVTCRENMYEEISINANDIDTNSTRKNVLYTENDREYKKRISDTVDIIYNGEAYPDASVSEIYPDYGELRLIDRDGDSVFDIIFVTSYSPLISGGVDRITGKIINKYTGSGFDAVVDIDEDDDVRITDIFGEPMEMEDITENTVLFIKKPKTGDMHRYEIVLSQKYVKGQLSKINMQEGLITAEDSEYKLSDAVGRAIANECIQALTIGKRYTLYLDIYDEVIYYETAKESGGYAYINKAYFKRHDDEYFADLFCVDGEWHKVRLREKIKCDGESVKAEVFVNTALVNELVKYELDDDGRLKSIEYPVLTSVKDPNYRKYTEKNVFTRVDIDGERWYLNTKSIGGKYYTSNIEWVFFVPADGDTSKFGVQKFVGDEDGMTLSMYDIDEFGYGKVALERGSTASSVSYSSTDSFMIVDKVITAYIDGETVSVISGFMEGQNMSFTGDDTNVFSGLKRGDVIRVKYNGGNKVARIDPVLTDSDMPVSVINGWNKGGIKGANITGASSIYKGVAAKVDYTGGRIRMGNIVKDEDENGNEAYFDVTWRVVSKTIFTLYDSDKKEAKSGTINDIVAGDDIIVRHHGGELLEVLTIKK